MILIFICDFEFVIFYVVFGLVIVIEKLLRDKFY